MKKIFLYLSLSLLLGFATRATGNSQIHGRSVLHLTPNTRALNELTEFEWTPEQSILDLDIVSVKVLKDGSLLVLGNTFVGASQETVLVKLDPDNKLDYSFGYSGVAPTQRVALGNIDEDSDKK